jgi:hypothetical protein
MQCPIGNHLPEEMTPNQLDQHCSQILHAVFGKNMSPERAEHKLGCERECEHKFCVEHRTRQGGGLKQ